MLRIPVFRKRGWLRSRMAVSYTIAEPTLFFSHRVQAPKCVPVYGR